MAKCACYRFNDFESATFYSVAEDVVKGGIVGPAVQAVARWRRSRSGQLGGAP